MAKNTGLTYQSGSGGTFSFGGGAPITIAKPAVYGPSRPAPKPAVLGTSVGSPAPAPQQSFSGVPEIPTPQQPQIDFDALIAPALQGLDEAIGPLQQGYEANVQSINSGRTNQLAANQANITGQQNILGQAATSQKGQAQNAADEARRQYAEIQQGLQSRYGGTTGTGAFATELAGRQTLQNMGQTRQQLSNALLAIDQKKQQVEEVGRIATQDIEDKARDQLNQAKNQLDTAMADIRRQKGELQARKAELAANAIQLYQNTVNQISAQNAAFKQNIYLAQMQAAQQLEAARQSGAQATTQFSQGLGGINAAQQTTPVGNEFSPEDYAKVRSGQAVVGGGGASQFLTGQGASPDFYSQLERNYGLTQ